jgi:uncharacterized glyoxalase superfamily protein PhnB
MQSLIPNMAVKNIQATVQYYQQHFGFELQMVVDTNHEISNQLDDQITYLWVMVQHGNVSILFQEVESLKEDVGGFFNTLGASATFYISVEDVSSLFEQVKETVTVIKPLETTWYGQQEFYVQDINGYVIAFAQPAEG